MTIELPNAFSRNKREEKEFRRNYLLAPINDKVFYGTHQDG